MSEKREKREKRKTGEESERVLNDSPAQKYIKQVCADCREFTDNHGLCAAGSGDILQCQQIREKNLQMSLLSSTEDMFSKFFSPDPGCKCRASGLDEKLDISNKGDSV
ncbi:MAG: hypothetical protein PHH85_02025 [Candidatus Methanoperedens sp.]|nr:hypothetical protein [Candidatus Methanoperedens sp.]